MDAEDAGSLRFVVAGGDEDFLNIFVFDLAEREELAAGGRDVEIGWHVVLSFCGSIDGANVLANFFGKGSGIDVAFGSEDDGALDDVFQFPNVAGPGIFCKSSAAAGVNPVKRFFKSIPTLRIVLHSGQGPDGGGTRLIAES